MEPKVSYVVVGAFVAVFGAMLIVIVLWLVRGGPQKPIGAIMPISANPCRV